MINNRMHPLQAFYCHELKKTKEPDEKCLARVFLSCQNGDEYENT